MTRQGKLAAARCLHLLLAPFLLSSVLCKEERVEGWISVVIAPDEASEGPQLVLRLANTMAGAPGFKFMNLKTLREDTLAEAISSFAPGARVAVVGELRNSQPATGTTVESAPYLVASSIDLLDDINQTTELGGYSNTAATRSAAASDSASGDATPMKALFLIVSTTCGGPRSLPAATREELEAILFDSGNAGGGSSSDIAGSSTGSSNGSSSSSSSSSVPTLQSYVRYCSNGRAALSPDTSRVLDSVVIPCAGPVSAATSQPVWLTSRCQTGDMLGWGDAAVEAAKQQLGPDGLASYHHVVLVLPRDWRLPPSSDGAAVANGSGGGGCAGFTASGEVGVPRRNADGSPAYAFSWLSGERYPMFSNYFHEMSHNLGLLHAGTANGCQYCDATCVMGYCCDRVCPNAAHMWALGWADPASGPSAADAQGQGGDLGVTDGGAAAAAAMGGSLVLEGLTEGLTLPYRLPAQHSSDASFVMIDAAAATGGIRYFLSYRDGTTSGVYDSTVGSSLHVHGHLTGTARRRYTDTGAWMDSVHVAALAAGDVWRDEQTRLQVRAVAISGGEAVVRLCRAPVLQLAAGTAAPVNSSAANWSACDMPAGGSVSVTGGAEAIGVSSPAPSPAQGEPAGSAGQAQTTALATQQNVTPTPAPTPDPTTAPSPSPVRQAQASLRNNGSPTPTRSPSAPSPPQPDTPSSPSPPGPSGTPTSAEAAPAATGSKRKAKRASPSPPPWPSPSPETAPTPGGGGGGGGGKTRKQPTTSPRKRGNGAGRLRRLLGRAFE